MSNDTLYAIVALDLNEGAHEFFEVRGAEPYNWAFFIERCNSLLKTSLTAHVCLIKAAIRYATITGDSPERRERGKALRAFLGNDFPIDDLGTWTNLGKKNKRIQATLHAMNKTVAKGGYEDVYVFVNAENRDDASY